MLIHQVEHLRVYDEALLTLTLVPTRYLQEGESEAHFLFSAVSGTFMFYFAVLEVCVLGNKHHSCLGSEEKWIPTLNFFQAVTTVTDTFTV